MERLLALYPCLGNLPEQLSLALSEIPVVHLAKGFELFDEGAACTGFPLLMAGQVRVIKSAPNGRGLYLYSVHAGESCVLTQSCLLGQRTYSARGLAHSEVTLCLIPQALFHTLLSTHAPFRHFVFALFAERFSELIALIEEVAFKRLDQRLARLLIERGPDLKVTHQELADDLGSVREIVTRLLHHFAAEGWVDLAREHISVREPGRLASFADPDASG